MEKSLKKYNNHILEIKQKLEQDRSTLKRLEKNLSSITKKHNRNSLPTYFNDIIESNSNGIGNKYYPVSLPAKHAKNMVSKERNLSTRIFDFAKFAINIPVMFFLSNMMFGVPVAFIFLKMAFAPFRYVPFKIKSFISNRRINSLKKRIDFNAKKVALLNNNKINIKQKSDLSIIKAVNKEIKTINTMEKKAAAQSKKNNSPTQTANTSNLSGAEALLNHARSVKRQSNKKSMQDFINQSNTEYASYFQKEFTLKEESNTQTNNNAQTNQSSQPQNDNDFGRSL